MKKYRAKFYGDGWYEVDVRAKNEEEAMELIYSGEGEVFDWEISEAQVCEEAYEVEEKKGGKK
jgi:hypothetical protein